MWAALIPALEWAGLLSGGYVLNDLFGWFGSDDETKPKPTINWFKVLFLLAGGIVLFVLVKWVVKLFKR